MKYVVHPVILCGGAGTRLWPLSTPKLPKQFKALTSSKLMIEETAERFSSCRDTNVRFAQPIAVGAVEHQDLLHQYIPHARIILEPFRRNTAPAVAAACLASQPNQLILISPADHSIKNVAAFHHAIAKASKAATAGSIVTFGIPPTHAATEYGYLKTVKADDAGHVIDVEEFVEKPNLAAAQSFLGNGSYYWNSGIFLFRADTMLQALERYAPDILSATRSAMRSNSANVILLDPAAFEPIANTPIDYAVMEKATNVKTIPVDMAWSDVGGFSALHGLLTSHPAENYTHGPVVLQNSHGMYVRSEGPAIAADSVSNLIVVATEHEVVIAPMKGANVVKALGTSVRRDWHSLGFSTDLLEHVVGWFWTAIDTWSNIAWDEHNGGFVEQLTMNGDPDLGADRRIRVQARQIFSFAKSIELGSTRADRALYLVKNGIDHIDLKLRHPDGGWVHKTRYDGSILDSRRDLYDHAFILLAAAASYRITGIEVARQLASDVIEFLDTKLRDRDHGGWFEGTPNTLPRRANPHMHLLEAFMEHYRATGSAESLAKAADIVHLFESRYFAPNTNILVESFTSDWKRVARCSKTAFEPGHHFGWATLLYRYEQLTGHDSLSWRRRLIATAERFGINSETGFAMNVGCVNGQAVNQNSRLWHQLERLRAHLLQSDEQPVALPEQQLLRLFSNFLDPGPDGGWIDEVDASGIAISKTVPASMLYHAVTAIEPLF